MSPIRRVIVAGVLLAAFGCNQEPKAPPAAEQAQGFAYPTSKREDVKETLHGVEVSDPYRWLEDPDSPAARTWIDAQNQLTFGHLGKLAGREQLLQRLTALWDFERTDVVHREGSRYFFEKNSGLQNQAVLYWKDGKDAEAKVLLDPNTLEADGTAALKDWVPSHDGKLLAYGIAKAGSDWTEWRVREVDTGKDTGDLLQWAKFTTVSWTKDNKGFFYSRYNEPKPGDALEEANYYNKLYYHRVGQKQAEDSLVYERADQKEWGFDGTVSDDGKTLVITVWKGTDDKFLIFTKDLGKPGAKAQELVTTFEAEYSFRGNDGDTFYFKTNKDAPRGKLVAVSLKTKQWKDVVAEAPETLEGVQRVGDTFVLRYLKDARAQLKVVETSGKLVRDVTLPGLGTVHGPDGDRTATECHFSFESFTQPATVYRYDVKSGALDVFAKPAFKADLAEYETTQVFYKSKDGTEVPMFITHKKGAQLDGKLPTLLYGYGGFNIPLTPTFSVANLVWMEMGGVYALANLRGGGEYGEAWHKAGTLDKKQNVFDDFIAAAEWLVANKYTSAEKLAIHGRSNGGLLVGAAITQRPELFGAALPAVGVMDMLRFHKFTIGWAWVDDYGSPDDAAQFKALRAYSPYHNLKKGTRYPATLITTADHDDRVVPAHSFKFAAALQEAQGGPAPVMIRIDTKAGHGAGKPTGKKIEEIADQWAFLKHALKVDETAAPTATAKQ